MSIENNLEKMINYAPQDERDSAGKKKDNEIVVEEIVRWVKSSPDSKEWGAVDGTKENFDPDRFKPKKDEAKKS